MELDTHMSLVGSDFREQGIFILASNYAAIFDYGSPPDARAPHFAFATLDVILRRSNDAASLEVMMPSIYLSLAFLWCMARAPENVTHINPHVPWLRIANVLNELIQLDNSKEPYMQQPGSSQHLEEDDYIRDLSWSGIYYSQNHFHEMVDSDKAWVKGLSATGLRIKRCLWLGKALARVGLCFSSLCKSEH